MYCGFADHDFNKHLNTSSVIPLLARLPSTTLTDVGRRLDSSLWTIVQQLVRTVCENFRLAHFIREPLIRAFISSLSRAVALGLACYHVC